MHNKFHHASFGSEPGWNFFYIMGLHYTKQPLPYEQQLQCLKARGLHINDEQSAMEILHTISYFRLANYWRPLEADKTTHQFKPNATFDNVLALYSFDKELRQLIFSCIQTIEIALRTKMIHNISMTHGAFWFLDTALCSDMEMFNGNLQYVRKEVNRSKEDFIQEHRIKYSTPDFPPAWKTFEVLSLGTMSKLFENMNDFSVKKKIAREFNLPQHLVLESWVRSLTVLRNCVCHHARVWNRKFPVKPEMYPSLRGKWVNTQSVPPEKLYAQLCCLQYLFDAIAADNMFRVALRELLEKYPTVDIVAMGFPQDWQNEPLWTE